MGTKGHPSEVMDMSFSDQALAVEYVAKNKEALSKMGSVVLEIPHEIDKTVAELKCKAMGLKLDVLTPEQDAYLHGWAEGT
jgi:adenosylhomocysteinase